MKLIQNIQVGSGCPEDVLAEMATKKPEQFMRRMNDLIANGKLSWGHIRSLPRLLNALIDVQVPTNVEFAGQVRRIEASAFPLLSGALTANEINQGIKSLPTISEQLVTERNDAKRSSVYADVITAAPDKGEEGVKDSEPFPEIGASEKMYEVRSKRQGYRISVSAETIEQNDIAGIVTKCNTLVWRMGKDVEKQSLRRICDVDGSGSSPAEPYVYRPNMAGTAVYTTSTSAIQNAPSGTRVINNALVDAASLEVARKVLAAMVDDDGDRMLIPMSEAVLLVPDELVTVADIIGNSEMTPGVENERNNWGPRGRYRPTVLSSGYLDTWSTSAWYLGIFKDFFVRKWALNMEYVTISGNTQKFLEDRTAFQARVAWNVEVGGVGKPRVVQCLEGTVSASAPS